MQQIGFSLVDKDGTEIKFWGDAINQLQSIPDIVDWPSGDRTYCPTSGMENGGAILVPRMLDLIEGQEAGDKIAFDGTQMTVTRTFIPERRLIAKSVIVDRLYAAGKLEAARAALDASDLYTQEKWNSRLEIYSDDPSALALLVAIGADPISILSP